MEKLARQITGVKIQEFNERISNVDNQVLRYLTPGYDGIYLLTDLITSYVGFDDVEMISYYSDLLVGYQEQYQEVINTIKELELEIPKITLVKLSRRLKYIDGDIDYLVDRLKGIKHGMLKKEYKYIRR